MIWRNNTTVFNLQDMFRQTYAIFSSRSSLQFEYANYNDLSYMESEVYMFHLLI